MNDDLYGLKIWDLRGGDTAFGIEPHQTKAILRISRSSCRTVAFSVGRVSIFWFEHIPLRWLSIYHSAGFSDCFLLGSNSFFVLYTMAAVKIMHLQQRFFVLEFRSKYEKHSMARTSIASCSFFSFCQHIQHPA